MTRRKIASAFPANPIPKLPALAIIAAAALATQPAFAFPGDQAPLVATPDRVLLRGPDATAQILVEARNLAGRPFDATRDVSYVSSDPDVVVVDTRGLAVARGDGSATVAIRRGDHETTVAVTVVDYASGRPMNFANDVVPIFTKLGCNGGGCHGKSGGQNGFRLGLLGFDPALDYETLVKENRGRRLFPAAPENSLLILKGAALVPHGGGRKLEPDSPEYRVLVRWIKSGMPYGSESDPTIARLEIHPLERDFTPGAPDQQLRVLAVYTDESVEDVTRRAQYQSNDTEVVRVEDGGLVSAAEMAGQAAVMARYQGQVAVFTARVPLEHSAEPPTYDHFRPRNFLDEIALKQWKALGVVPSETCTDAEFIRRASLDIAGVLPDADEIRAFVANPDPDKRDKLVDQLLDRPEYAANFALKWADILKNKRQGNEEFRKATHQFHAWIRDALNRDVPYDKFAADILTASGSTRNAPPVHWYRTLRTPDAFVDDTAQVFLGMRLQCARCHHHPFEKWSQDDYYGFAAYFGKIGRKPAIDTQALGRASDEVIFAKRDGDVRNPATGKLMVPKGLGDRETPPAPGQDPRALLAAWLAETGNPYFAPALVNRYWAHFFARGLVEPIDDMRVTNPASNPELLQALADDFVANRFSLKHLVRTICRSATYSLSSVPNESNARDKQTFARYYPKRMSAEVLHDAIAALTLKPTDFAGMFPGARAIDLPDESVGSTFLDTFGRPKRDTACECERVSDATLGQSLMLLNSAEVQTKLAADDARAKRLAEDPAPDDQKIRNLFWLAFAREPDAAELNAALEHIERNSRENRRKEAYEDILWALLNSKEFQFID